TLSACVLIPGKSPHPPAPPHKEGRGECPLLLPSLVLGEGKPTEGRKEGGLHQKPEPARDVRNSHLLYLIAQAGGIQRARRDAIQPELDDVPQRRPGQLDRLAGVALRQIVEQIE